MSEKLQSAFIDLLDRFILYFPQLLAGLALLIFGWFLAWLVKRMVMRLAIILKLEYILARSRWKVAFQKADVRFGFYNFLGNVFSFIVFLIFLDFAFITWNLKILSDFLGQIISIFPRLLTAAATFGLGWIAARWAANGLLRTLRAGNISYASAIAHYARVMLLVLAAAISMVELNIAREIVLIGFAATYITLCTIAVVLSIMVGKRMINNPEQVNKQESAENEEVK
ncbi:MAG TPA: hypothetical protein VJZ49_09845 [Syntrophales bacterium]|nr:hypothetical protein [Syntrophales bacterium]